MYCFSQPVYSVFLLTFETLSPASFCLRAGEGVVPEPAYEAEEGPGEGRGAALGCALGDGGYVQRPASVGTGPLADTARPAATLRQLLAGHRCKRRILLQQRDKLGYSVQKPSVASHVRLKHTNQRPPWALQLPRAHAAGSRGVTDLLCAAGHGRLAGREPAGTVSPLPELLGVRAVLADQRQRGQESFGIMSLFSAFCLCSFFPPSLCSLCHPCCGCQSSCLFFVLSERTPRGLSEL